MKKIKKKLYYLNKIIDKYIMFPNMKINSSQNNDCYDHQDFSFKTHFFSNNNQKANVDLSSSKNVIEVKYFYLKKEFFFRKKAPLYIMSHLLFF